jgi:hypothetical protein
MVEMDCSAIVAAINRQFPLAAEVALVPGVGVSADDRDAHSALVDALAAVTIPRIPAAPLHARRASRSQQPPFHDNRRYGRQAEDQ